MVFLKEPPTTYQDCCSVIPVIPSHVWEYPKYRVIPETSGLPEISGNTRYFGLPATRYPMIFKTESGRVGYRKKYRVAGRVRVPVGHCPYVGLSVLKYCSAIWNSPASQISVQCSASPVLAPCQPHASQVPKGARRCQPYASQVPEGASPVPARCQTTGL